MDGLDFAIYRFLSPGGEARFWAGRRVIDPLVSPREIAERVGISESGVRARLLHLTERGFLRDRAVLPNPALFGQHVFVADLLVRQPGEVDRILRDLALVDGVIFTRDILDEDQRKIGVHFVADSAATAARSAALLGRLVAAPRPPTPQPYYLPACDRELSPLDWKVLECVRRRPEATFGEIAEDVGISLKTAARCYHQLADARACWWTHGPSSEEFPLAYVSAEIENSRDREAVVRWISSEAPAWMPVAPDGFGLRPEDTATIVAGLVPADAPTILERFLRRFAGAERVVRVRRTFPLGSASYPTWFTERIAEHVHRRS